MTGLLDLPAEVRVMIYDYLFPQAEYDVEYPRLNKNMANVHTSIIRVNPILALEALPILYSHVIFEIEASRKSVQWLRRMEQTNRDLLREVTCFVSPDQTDRYVSELFGLLARCSIISLTLHLRSIKDLLWLDNSDLGHFKSMHGFASVSMDFMPYSDWNCWRGHRSQASYQVVQHRLDNGILILKSSCPNYCWGHRGQSRDQATASLHFSFQSRPCVTCTLKETWYETTTRGSIFRP